MDYIFSRLQIVRPCFDYIWFPYIRILQVIFILGGNSFLMESNTLFRLFYPASWLHNRIYAFLYYCRFCIKAEIDSPLPCIHFFAWIEKNHPNFHLLQDRKGFCCYQNNCHWYFCCKHCVRLLELNQGQLGIQSLSHYHYFYLSDIKFQYSCKGICLLNQMWDHDTHLQNQHYLKSQNPCPYEKLSK